MEYLRNFRNKVNRDGRRRSQPGRPAQLVGLVGLFPAERREVVGCLTPIADHRGSRLFGLATEMSVSGRAPIHRMEQVKHLQNAIRAQIKMFADEGFNALFGDMAGAKGGHRRSEERRVGKECRSRW